MVLFLYLAPLPLEDQLKSATLYQASCRVWEYRQKRKTSSSFQIVHSLFSKRMKYKEISYSYKCQ